LAIQLLNRHLGNREPEGEANIACNPTGPPGYLESMLEWALVGVLAINAVVLFSYRVFRLTKGGPTADAVGGAILAAILAGVAVAIALGAGWARWVALLYGVGFGIVVMPLWTLAVLIPMPPGRVDYAFTGFYWITLIAIAVLAIAA
jgi:hypothetical protein